MNLSVICISRDPIATPLNRIPYVNYTEGWRPLPRDRSRGRIAYLAERRNSAVKITLSKYPQTTHFLMIDSYYMNQPDSINALIARYENRSTIHGGATWIHRKRRLWPENAFWDAWTTPEFRELFWSKDLRTLPPVKVKAVGAVYICPVEIWKRRGYGIPGYGCEHNFLCEGSSCFVDFSAEFWRDPFVYPMHRRLRSSAGYFLRGTFRERKHLPVIPS